MSKTTTAAAAIISLLVLAVTSGPTVAQEARKMMNGTPLPFYVYNGIKTGENHYAPSGWMGDYGDLRFTDKHKFKPNDAHPVIKVIYNAKGAQGAGWAGIYWQHPANNWGNREGGYNLNGSQKLVFKARGEKGGEQISEFKVGGIEGNYRDSGSAAIGPLELSKQWTEYTIPLEGQELSSIAGGFCLTMSRDQNPDGATVYLDDIRFE
jgi:hypothetical protein